MLLAIYPLVIVTPVVASQSPPDAARSTLTPTLANITADGMSTQVLTVTVKYSNGDNFGKGGDTVVITLASGSGTVGPVTDNGDGTYTATVTSPTAVGSGVFVATIDHDAVKNGNTTQTQATINYVGVAEDATQSILAPTSATITANGTTPQVLTVTAKDSVGNLITTGGATVTIIRSSGSGTISPVTDNGDGTYTATVTSPTAVGSGVFVATLGGKPGQKRHSQPDRGYYNLCSGDPDEYYGESGQSGGGR